MTTENQPASFDVENAIERIYSYSNRKDIKDEDTSPRIRSIRAELQAAYAAGAQPSQAMPTCSDERPCIPCYTDQGKCLVQIQSVAKLPEFERFQPNHAPKGAIMLPRRDGGFVRFADVTAALPQPSPEVIVTKNEVGVIVAVTRQDSEGRVIELIAESSVDASDAARADEISALLDVHAPHTSGNLLARVAQLCLVSPLPVFPLDAARGAAPLSQPGRDAQFKIGQHVRKKSGSEWQGVIVGTYCTVLTPEGYAVESEKHKGSVQIYPVGALELFDAAFTRGAT